MQSMAVKPEEREGTRIAIRVTPRARRSSLSWGVDVEGRPLLAARLAAPPVDGAANKALVELLAKALGVARSSVAIVSGDTSRNKIVDISMLSVTEISDRLAAGAD